MSLYLRGRVWWSRIIVNGTEHQFSTKCRQKNAARAIEAAKRTDIAKGLVGLSAPTLTTFATRFVNSLPGRVAKETVLFYVRHFKPLLDFRPHWPGASRGGSTAGISGFRISRLTGWSAPALLLEICRR